MAIPQLTIAPALIDQVHDRLLAAIIDGSLAPGARLTQESVAADLGVSRQPVSHALQVLKRRGLVMEHGRRGLMVAPIDAARLIALYQVREVLDGLAAGLAAARVARGDASVAERADLEAALARGLALRPGVSMTERVEADVGFHSSIHRLSGNTAITETVAEMWPHFMRSMAIILADGGIRTRVWDEHAGIVAAVLAGDPHQAERLARAHTADAARATGIRLAAQNDDLARH